MKPKRDPVTGRFVSKETRIEEPMKIQEYDGVSVSIVEGKERKSLVDAITVLQATYGINSLTINIDPEHIKIGRKASNRMAGSDPAPKQRKIMTITVMKKGEKMTRGFNEGEVVEF
jgi:hypothetical protein